MSLFVSIFILLSTAQANVARELPHTPEKPPTALQESGFNVTQIKLADEEEAPLVFDIPISYNKHVKKWIKYYQTNGRKWFTKWLERSHYVLPQIKQTFRREGLPMDLTYMAMIESGFSNHATSTAFAVGPWQFIRATGERFGLKINWWIDERKDFDKSTRAAAKYIKQLYGMFGSWYLVAAAYNTGENRVRNIINKHQTKNFWELVNKGAFVEETENYIPKLIAATLISKAPSLYGFRNLHPEPPPKYDFFAMPGGSSLKEIAEALDVSHAYMKQLNPELLAGYIPPSVSNHRIRIPRGANTKLAEYMKKREVKQ